MNKYRITDYYNENPHSNQWFEVMAESEKEAEDKANKMRSNSSIFNDFDDDFNPDLITTTIELLSIKANE